MYIVGKIRSILRKNKPIINWQKTIGVLVELLGTYGNLFLVKGIVSSLQLFHLYQMTEEAD